MKINHISIFLPNDSAFYRRLFKCLEKPFISAGIRVSGCCRLLTEPEMYLWLAENKPDAIFEMNRVKNDIPILHEYGIPHITWVVDFQGRTENHIKGSEITYFFDPGWDENYVAGGLQDWLPPGTCTRTFTPLQFDNSNNIEFSFIGHIPRPWTDNELARKLSPESEITFETLLGCYEKHMEETRFEIKTHKDLKDIINNIVGRLLETDSDLDVSVYYDLMERTKRLKNRVELLSFALNKSESLVIYGSPNWEEWPLYQKYYKYFVDCPHEMNFIHQASQINLHDGLSFHFRAIDCMASGGFVFWHDNSDIKSIKQGRGLHDFFDNQWHFYKFREDSFDEVYENFKRNSGSKNKAKNDMIEIVNSYHTWDHRVAKIINDIKVL